MVDYKQLKEGDFVVHRSNTKVTMVVYSVHSELSKETIDQDKFATIHCRWLSSLNEPQEKSYRAFELNAG